LHTQLLREEDNSMEDLKTLLEVINEYKLKMLLEDNQETVEYEFTFNILSMLNENSNCS
jgi:hypothetical protein